MNTYLKVYEEKFEFISGDETQIFEIGKQSELAKKRYIKINDKLKNGYFINIIEEIEQNGFNENITDEVKAELDKLINSMNDNEGRALVTLTIIQACIKSIDREQNIRLHKGNQQSNKFSFKEGISMRQIGSKYITTVLKDKKLMSLSQYGAFMTRTLSENYPYTSMYCAKIKGAKTSWLKIVNYLEEKCTEDDIAINILKYILNQLIISRDKNNPYQNEVFENVNNIISNESNDINIEKVYDIFYKTMIDYGRGARLFEIGTHSLLNAIENKELLNGVLCPLSSMRKADKKANDIGDVQIINENSDIIEAWDCKYLKDNLDEEIKELEEKLSNHDNIQIAGFITDKKIELTNSLENKIKQIESSYNTNIKILSFNEFLDLKTKDINKQEIGREWLKMYVSTITRNNVEKAPLEEPNIGWVRCIDNIINNYFE